ncbi:MAG: hypothetical protein WC501_04170 [Candidatus Micrarchaeia archaeon]
MDYYSKLTLLFSEEELNEKIKSKINEFHGYISKDAAVNLIAKEYNLYKKDFNIKKIKEIKPEERDITISAKIQSIKKRTDYPSGKYSREIILFDDTGSIPLVFWEKNIDILAALRLNDEILVQNSYERFGRLNFGYKSKLTVINKSKFSSFDILEEEKTYSLRGTISKTDKNNPFEFYLSDGKIDLKVEIQKDDKRFLSVGAGDDLILENVFFKNSRILVLGKSRVLLKKTKNFLSGIVQSVNFKENKMNVVFGKNTIFLEENSIYSFLNVKKTKNIPLETLINLKKNFYIGKNIIIQFRDDKKTQIEKIFVRGG